MSIILNVTVPIPGGGGTGTLTAASQIIVNKSSGTAPMAVIFDTDLSDADRLTHHVKWTFDDPGTYSRLDSARLSGRDANTAFGHVAAHTFAAAGTYTVTCYIHDGTDFQTLSYQVVITAANTDFANTNTIAVAPDGNWSGKPAGALEVTTLSAALNALNANNGGRIVLKGGQTFDVPSGNPRRILGGDLNGETSVNTVVIGAYPGFGTSARPIIDTVPNNSYLEFNGFNNTGSQISVYGCDFVGGYVSATGSGSSRKKGLSFGTTMLAANITIHDCTFDGFAECVQSIGDSETSLWCGITGCEWTNWEAYGVFWRRGNISIVGCLAGLDPTTPNGSEGQATGQTPNYPDEGCMRIVEGGVCAIQMNDLFSNSASLGSPLGFQPCIRTETKSRTNGVAYYAITQNQGEGWGGGAVTASHAAAGTNHIAGAYVVKMNHFVGSTASYKGIYLLKGNSVVENNIVVQPNVVNTTVSRFRAFIEPRSDVNHGPGNAAAPLEYRNNTFVDLRTNATNGVDSEIVNVSDVAAAGWNAFVQESNIFHAPARNTPVVVSNLNATDVFTPQSLGHKLTPATGFTSPTPVGVGSTASYEPQTGSGAIGAAAPAQVAVDDFNGNIRSAVLAGLSRSLPSDGAFEPALES